MGELVLTVWFLSTYAPTWRANLSEFRERVQNNIPPWLAYIAPLDNAVDRVLRLAVELGYLVYRAVHLPGGVDSIENRFLLLPRTFTPLDLLNPEPQGRYKHLVNKIFHVP